ncbi:MAG: hypothetical protein ACE5IY_07355 [bacterium]
MSDKPQNCTCGYPKVIARNICGHAEDCPVYLEWARQVAEKRGLGPDPPGKTK